jgi:hypothetical protein
MRDDPGPPIKTEFCLMSKRRVLTDPKQLPDEVATLLTGWRAQLTGIEVFGGPVAVGDSVLGRVVTAVGGRAV